jgi:hypothetical protein
LAWVAWDIDRDRRPVGLSDAGADEYMVLIYLPLIMREAP